MTTDIGFCMKYFYKLTEILNKWTKWVKFDYTFSAFGIILPVNYCLRQRAVNIYLRVRY